MLGFTSPFKGGLQGRISLRANRNALVYFEPSTNIGVAAQVPKGELVGLLINLFRDASNQYWYKVETTKYDGWVMSHQVDANYVGSTKILTPQDIIGAQSLPESTTPVTVPASSVSTQSLVTSQPNFAKIGGIVAAVLVAIGLGTWVFGSDEEGLGGVKRKPD